MTETVIDGIQLYIAEHGHGGPVIFRGMYPHQEHEVEYLWETLMEIVPERDFLFVTFQVEDWNRDFLPWEAPAAFGTEGVVGE